MNKNYSTAKASSSSKKSVKLSQLRDEQARKDVIAYFGLSEDVSNEDIVAMFAEPKLMRETLKETFTKMEALVKELGINPIQVPAELTWNVLPKGAIFQKVAHPSKPKLFVNIKPYNLMGVDGIVTIEDLQTAGADLFTKNAQQVSFGAGFRTKLHDPAKYNEVSSTDLLGARKVKEIILQGAFVASQPMGYWSWNIHPLFQGLNNPSLDDATHEKYVTLIEFVQNGLLKLGEAYKQAQNDLFGHLPREEKPAFITPRFPDFPQIGETRNTLSICAHKGYGLVVFAEADGYDLLAEGVFDEVYNALFSARPARDNTRSTGGAKEYKTVTKSGTAHVGTFDTGTPKKKGKPASAKTATKVTKAPIDTLVGTQINEDKE